MEALDQARGSMERIRDNPRIAIAIAVGVLLLLAWIGWAIYVTSSNGAAAGLGVVIAWPAMLAALALIALPVVGGYLLVRRLSTDGSSPEAEEDGDTGEDETSEREESEGDREESEGDEREEDESGEDESDEGDSEDHSDDSSVEKAEPEQAAAD